MPRKVDNHWCLGYAKMKWSHTNKSQSYSPIAVGVCQSVGSDSSPLYLGWILLNMVCSGCQLGTSSNPKMPKKVARQNKKGVCFILKNLNKTPVKCSWAVVVHFWLHALLLVVKWSSSPLFGERTCVCRWSGSCRRAAMQSFASTWRNAWEEV